MRADGTTTTTWLRTISTWPLSPNKATEVGCEKQSVLKVLNIPSRSDLKENHLALGIIRRASDWMRFAWRPLLR